MLLLGSVLTATIVLLVFYFFWNRGREPKQVPADVAVLYQIGRGPFAPSSSPFPLKLETFLRMNKIPYMPDHSAKFSTKGKTPWMEYNGVAVADTHFCIQHLKKERDIDNNSSLSLEQKAVARAMQKMTEENLYWTLCLEMFCGDSTEAVETVMPYTGVKLWVTMQILKRVLQKEANGHGIGRHTNTERWSIAMGDMSALSDYIGDKKFLMGDIPCEEDCAVFGMLAQICWHMPGSRHEKFMRENTPNLIAYCERMKDEFWPDWDERISSGKNFVSDHEHMYFESELSKR
ncbi:hypothetical protein ScPMuIL_006772 [Solemya velum]